MEKCPLCRSVLRLVQNGELRKTRKSIGEFIVSPVTYLHCDACGEDLYLPETMQAIEAKERELVEAWLKRQPMEAFIEAADAAKRLGVSRQALHQSRRVRDGIIYYLTRGTGEREYRVYLLRSVEQFLETGDGRFRIPAEELEAATSSAAKPGAQKAASLEDVLKQLTADHWQNSNSFPMSAEVFLGCRQPAAKVAASGTLSNDAKAQSAHSSAARGRKEPAATKEDRCLAA